jgi:hypothetical protein
LINGTAEMLWETRRTLQRKKFGKEILLMTSLQPLPKFQNSNNTLSAFSLWRLYNENKNQRNLMIVSFFIQATETRNLVHKMELAEMRESLKEEVKSLPSE